MKSSNSITVAQFVDNLSVGGMEGVAIMLANNLAKIGYNSHLICSRREGPLRSAVRNDVHVWCAKRKHRWDLGGIRRIAKYIQDNRIDIVHSHNHFSSYLIRIVFQLFKQKALHVVHDHRGRAIDEKKTTFYDWLMLRHVDAYISVTQQLKNRVTKLLSLPPEQCVFIPNGIEIQHPQAVTHDIPTVIQVANLQEPKGHRTAIRAASIVHDRLPDLKWICAGRVSDPPDDYVNDAICLIQKLGLKDCVSLVGQCEDVRPLLCEANLGVLTSDYEGLPLALLEYMAQELPVVVTDVGQCGNIVRKAVAGMVVPPRDPLKLAEAVLAILSEPEHARIMGENGRRHVIQYFSADMMVERVHSLYFSLLLKSNRPRSLIQKALESQ